MVVLRGTEMMYKHVASVRADSEAGDIPRSKLETLSAGLSARIDDFTKVAATPGIKAYAENEFVRLPGFDAAASFTQMLNAMTAVRDWLDGRLAGAVVFYPLRAARGHVAWRGGQHCRIHLARRARGAV